MNKTRGKHHEKNLDRKLSDFKRDKNCLQKSENDVISGLKGSKKWEGGYDPSRSTLKLGSGAMLFGSCLPKLGSLDSCGASCMGCL